MPPFLSRHTICRGVLDQLNIDTDILEFADWITNSELQSLRTAVTAWIPEPSIPSQGNFANRLVSMQHYHEWDDKDAVGSILADKLRSVFGTFRVTECVYQELHLPWDIHCDFYKKNNVEDSNPWRSVLILLESAPSVTIIFKETSDSNFFWKYKQANPQSHDPVPLEFWQQHLDCCWPEDREWLTLDYVSESWRAKKNTTEIDSWLMMVLYRVAML